MIEDYAQSDRTSNDMGSDVPPSLSETIVQILPLQITDGVNQAHISLAQKRNIQRFLDEPDQAGSLSPGDSSLAAVPLSSLSNENLLIPRIDNPIRVSLTLREIVKLFSTRTIIALKRVWRVQVNETTISRLIRGKSTTVIATDGQNLSFLEVTLNETEKSNFATAPIVDEIMIKRSDLSKFLEMPVLPGTRSLPFRVELTEEQCLDLLNIGGVTIEVDDGKRTLSLVVASDDLDEITSGLSHRRDIWSPAKIEQTFGVMTKGDLSSSKAIEEAAQDQLQVLMGRMNDNLGRLSDDTGHLIREQVTLILPWVQNWSPQAPGLGLRTSSIALAPGESNGILDEGEKGASANFDLKQYLRGKLTANQEILLADYSDYVSVGAPLAISISENSTHIDCSNLRSSNAGFVARLGDKVDSASSSSGGDMQLSRALSNANRHDVLEVDYYQAVNRFKVTTRCDLEKATLGYMLENPLNTLPYDRNTVMRYQDTLTKVLLDKSLLSGFEAIGKIKEQHRVNLLSKTGGSRISTELETDRKKAKNTPANKADMEIINHQRESLERRVRSGIHLAQKNSQLLLDDENVVFACQAIATIGDENAASVLGTKFGSARFHDAEKCRIWLARQIYERRFPALFESISALAAADPSDIDIYEWGARFDAAVPTEFDIYELVNITNEPLREIHKVYYPLIEPLIQSHTDAELWWQKLDSLGLTIPQDNSLSRIIEGLILSHKRLLKFDGADFHTINGTQNSEISLDNSHLEEVGVARRLIRHIQDHSDYYSGAIFSSLSHKKRVSLLRATIDRAAPEVKFYAFDFNSVWVCGSSIVVGLDESSVPGARILLDEFRSVATEKRIDCVEVPVPGRAMRIKYVSADVNSVS